MMEKFADKTVAQQTELALRQLDSLEISPSVAAICFSKLIESQFTPAALADVIESDPALTAKAFSLLYQQGIDVTAEKLSLRQAIGRLPAQLLRDAIFAMNVSPAFEKALESGEVTKSELIKHSLAVACCAKEIAEAMSPKADAAMCYCAGLLHDIGKIALQQVMPKSFALIAEEAKQEQSHSCVIERKHLGLDHTIFGKRLAQKWHLPEEIGLAVWLHHSDTAAISQGVAEAKIAEVVQLADVTARQCGIGLSGSYDTPDAPQQLMKSLGVAPEKLEQISSNLSEQVNKRAEIIGIGIVAPDAVYLNVLHKTAVKLAESQSQLADDNIRLQAASSHLKFITEFLSSVSSADSPIDIAENFAVRWQKFYQTGLVCLYLAPPAGSDVIEAVLVESLSQSRVVTLQSAKSMPVIPQELTKNFGVLNAYQHIDWLFGQLDVDFNANQTKLMPLRSGGKAVGAIAFELRYPSDVELFIENFRMVTSAAGLALDLAMRGHNQEQFAERFLQLMGQPKAGSTSSPQAEEETIEVKDASESETVDIAVPEEETQKQEQTYLLSALAEMAGGAAHELNNPLAVISGRAQLLSQAETDPNKKRMLKQIEDNASEITRIVEDLMAFANPHEPKPARTNVRQMLDEAVQLAAMKEKIDKPNVQIDVAETANEIYADSAQVASAVANILCNSVESYPDKAGPVKITARTNPLAILGQDNFVKLEITDTGGGMDEQTLKKATQPFFSNRSAGRNRGMGLAHTHRLIELNRGTLNITSQPGTGTTVTILLPSRS